MVITRAVLLLVVTQLFLWDEGTAFTLGLRTLLHKGLKTIEDQLLPSSDSLPHTNFEGIFKPVDEKEPSLCEVEGTIPPSCYGLYARNGPNAAQEILHDYFLFDGDGMVHSVMMEEASCKYSAHYIKTHKYQDEEALGEAVHAKVGDLRYGPASLFHLTATAIRGFFGVIGECASLANTSLLYHKDSGSLIAMHEQGAPYALSVSKDGVIDTLGRTQFGGEFTGTSTEAFTAHPKLDPSDEVLYAYGYSFFEPFVKFYRIQHPNQEKLKVIKIPMKRSVMMHDFDITETHAVFLDNPLVFDISKTNIVGELPFQFVPEYGSRIGVIPLNAESGDEVKWFELPQSTFVFHMMNSWNEAIDEQGNPTKIEIVVAQYDDLPPFGKLGAEPNPFRVRLWKYGIDLESGEVYFNAEIADLTDRYDAEFPLVNPNLTGRKTRYGYFPVKDRENGDLITGFFKVDLEEKNPKDAIVGRVFYGESTNGGEGQFVPSLDPNASEDDGHFIVFTNTVKEGRATPIKSELRIYETKTMSSTPVAVIKIPSFVPFGFHGVFVPEQVLKETDRSKNLEVERYSASMIAKETGGYFQ